VKLELSRDRQTRQGTTGHLSVDGVPFCVTLERPAARFGDPHPCIPAGEYRVTLYRSPHFGRLMPLLEGVPGRGGIEIHWGNFVRDFEGCIGVGATRGELPDGSPTIWMSRATFDRLFDQLSAVIPGQPAGDGGLQPCVCTITVRDPQSATRSSAAAFADEREPDAQSV
jgi:Steigviridae/Suoliviridae L,D-carboxypeptidase/transpeptidase